MLTARALDLKLDATKHHLSPLSDNSTDQCKDAGVSQPWIDIALKDVKQEIIESARRPDQEHQQYSRSHRCRFEQHQHCRSDCDSPKGDSLSNKPVFRLKIAHREIELSVAPNAAAAMLVEINSLRSMLVLLISASGVPLSRPQIFISLHINC